MASKLRWPDNAYTSAYACGMKKPNYPVPAIPMSFEYSSTYRPVLIETYDHADGIASQQVYIRNIGNWEYLFNW